MILDTMIIVITMVMIVEWFQFISHENRWTFAEIFDIAEIEDLRVMKCLNKKLISNGANFKSQNQLFNNSK